MHEYAIGADDLLEITRDADPMIARIHIQAIREHQARALQETLLQLADQSSGRLVLDLEHLDQLTSAGVNAIVQGQDRCRKLDGRLVLVGLNADLTDLFKVTGLDRTLSIATHMSDAIMVFAGRKVKGKKSRAA